MADAVHAFMVFPSVVFLSNQVLMLILIKKKGPFALVLILPTQWGKKPLSSSFIFKLLTMQQVQQHQKYKLINNRNYVHAQKQINPLPFYSI